MVGTGVGPWVTRSPLHRIPPTTGPYAEGPPVIRILYGFVAPVQGEVRAVLLLGGDKTALGDRWYPTNLAQAERRLTVSATQRGWRIVR